MINTHCSHCGLHQGAMETSSRLCPNCHQWTYVNPTPVVCVLLKVAGGWEDEQDKEDGYNWANGILLVRRNIEPGFGELALPGGYVDMGENWQQASRRELFEETGVLTDADGYELYDVISTERSILLFTWNPRIEIDIRRIDMSLTNEETSELVFTREPVKLAFPAHTKVMHDFYTDQLDY